MKVFLIIATLIVFSFNSFAQTPKNGKYQSKDGMVNISIEVQSDGSLELTEPNKVSVYNKEGNYYRHSEQKYSMYMIRVGSPDEIYTFKDGYSNSEYKFTWIGSGEVMAEGCALYDKYLEKAEEAEDNEVQAWTFCAAAALAKCSYTSEGFETQAAAIVMTLKQILVNQEKCPCEDVIPASIWKNN
jgi:hypothetical protein